MPKHGVRFGPGMVVSPGEYRNTETGQIRYFDGTTPLPGNANAASWQQISDHYHPGEGSSPRRHVPADEAGGRSHGVRFAPGTVVSPGEYRNTETGRIRYFDGTTPLPGNANSASWQQISDHYHPGAGASHARHTPVDEASGRSHGVRFAPGTVVSPGEYRNVETGHIRYFDGNTPLPGGVNAASWQQISDHYHAEVGS